jgi:hypothetical protein
MYKDVQMASAGTDLIARAPPARTTAAAPARADVSCGADA